MQERFRVAVHVLSHDFAQVVYKDMGNVIVAGVQAGDESPEDVIVVEVVFLSVNQANLVVNIERHVAGGLNADDAALFVLGGVVEHVNELLGLAFALAAHN